MFTVRRRSRAAAPSSGESPTRDRRLAGGEERGARTASTSASIEPGPTSRARTSRVGWLDRRRSSLTRPAMPRPSSSARDRRRPAPRSRRSPPRRSERDRGARRARRAGRTRAAAHRRVPRSPRRGLRRRAASPLRKNSLRRRRVTACTYPATPRSAGSGGGGSSNTKRTPRNASAGARGIEHARPAGAWRRLTALRKRW